MKGIDLEALCLRREDFERMAEFFECDLDAAFEFVRTIWLPDAAQTADRLSHAIALGEWTAVAYLCDKLREGARCVGATRIMRFATDIERAALKKRISWLRSKVEELKAALSTLRSLLLGSPAPTRSRALGAPA